MFSGMLLRGKLTLTMLLVGLVPLLISVVLIEHLAINALQDRAFDQLGSLRATKKQQVERYFTQIQDQLKTFSESTMVVDAMRDFHRTFPLNPSESTYTNAQLRRYSAKVDQYYLNEFSQEFNNQVGTLPDVDKLVPRTAESIVSQYAYIANNTHPLGEKSNLDKSSQGRAYDRLHEKYHPVIRNYLEKFGYYDIFLIEPDTGYIVYSVFKELDYATSLIDGPYSNTNFARVFQAAKESQQNEVVFAEDFEPYLPSYNAAASFMASPIMENGKLTGVLVFQMPVDRINGIMQNSVGLGESGETYLVGTDLLMRSQSRFTDEPTLLKTKINTAGAKEAVAGQTGSAIFDDYRGVSVLSTYSPVEIEGLDWAILAEIDEDEALSAKTTLALVGVVLALIVSGIVIAVALRFSHLVLQQLGGDPTLIDKVAQGIADGDLDMNLDTNEKPVGVFASMVRMRNNLREQIAEDRRKAVEIGRIKQALDKVTSSVMMADIDFNIIYMNDSVQELFNKAADDLREVLPEFDETNLLGQNIDVFHTHPGHQRELLTQLKDTYSNEMAVGKRHLRITANPVLDEDGNRIGTVVEWEDRTQEVAVEKEVAAIVNASKEGDLSQRISLTDKEGFIASLSLGVNELVDISDNVIHDTLNVLGAMASGDLTKGIEKDYSGSFGELKLNANATVDKLTEIIRQIKETAEDVEQSSSELAQGNVALGQRTDEQATNLQETAASMEQMTSTVSQNAENSVKANHLASDAQEIAEKGGAVIGRAVDAMHEINRSSNQISDIINVIDEIAFQTNLLALNAAVEAARAGEQGRGFAVVAGEVRNLAQRTASSAKEIKELIQDSLQKVKYGSDQVNESGETLNAIVDAVKDVSEIIAGIAHANKEQSQGITQVDSSISKMDEMTQQNAALVEQASAASNSMKSKAVGLSDLISFFKISS